jgi:AraC-like DNA-binding protein
MLPVDGPYTPYIHACDAIPRPRPWELPRRRLAHWLIVTSVDGSERIVVNDVPYTVRSGETYIIEPGVPHDLGSTTGNRPVWIHFDLRYDSRRMQHPHAGPFELELGQRANLLQPNAREAFDLELPVLVPEAYRAIARDLVLRLVATWRRGSPLDGWSATHQLDALLLGWIEHLHAAVRPQVDLERRLANAEATALRSLHMEFGLVEFAAAAGLSRSRFSAVFTQRHDQSPATWLRQHRMERAKALLGQRHIDIARVGALVGYADPTVFGRTFRAHTGLTPSAWRGTQPG